MDRRNFIKQFAAGTGSLTASQFLAYFVNFGLPRDARAAAMAADVASEETDPRFLIYWFIEGGWMGYDMFNPVLPGADEWVVWEKNVSPVRLLRDLFIFGGCLAP